MSIVLDGTLGITTPSETNTGTLSVAGVTTLTGGLNAALPVLSGGTGVTTKTGTGAVVLGTAPTITGATITVAATAAPAFSAALITTNQSVTTNVTTKVSLNSTIFDTNSNFASARFTPTVAGYYLITGQMYADSGGSSTSSLSSIYKNGTVYADSGINTINVSMGAGGFVVSAIIFLNGSTEYVELYGTNGSATSPSFKAGTRYTYFSGAMIRSA